MAYKVEYYPPAVKDLKGLDKSTQRLVLKAIQKVSENPLSMKDGGYGKPLKNTNTTKLSGLLKIKLRNSGIRVVYKVEKVKSEMTIIVIAVRENNIVYKIAHKRKK